MGKRTKSREAQRRAAEQAIAARLQTHSKGKIGPAFIGSFCEFSPLYRAKIEAYRCFSLRAPEQWRCRLRTRSPEKRFLELVGFTFARYPVPRHLENVWIDETHAFADHIGAPAATNNDDCYLDFCRWYILAAQGGSLYKQAAHRYLSQLETHHFLTTPDDVGSTQRAFWYAVARAQTDNMGVARRIARTKLSAFPVALSFWKEAARYFARNPIPILEMDDLIDFFQAALQEDADFSLKGRSLPALRRRMQEWHATLRAGEVTCSGSWQGHPQPNATYEVGGEHSRAIWRFKQLRTGNDLFKEGQRMHHCIATYKARCINGEISIWSLRSEFPIGNLNRGVTIELCADGRIVQCRGFANRLPYANEVTMVKRWAREHGLTWQALER